MAAALTIWKFPVYAGINELEVPQGSEALTVQMQGTSPVIWALVDSERPKTKLRMWVIGTGHDFPQEAVYSNYLGTFQLPSLGLVFHVFTDMALYKPTQVVWEGGAGG